MKKNKKAQEEMVGFVLIIIIVAVIGLVLLGISLNKTNTQRAENSERIGSFLKSVSYYTTDCENPPAKYNSIEELVKLCYEQESCSDSRNTCSVLRDTLDILLNAGFLVKKGSSINGYSLSLKTGKNESEIHAIEPIVNGNLTNCAVKMYYNQYFIGIIEKPVMSLEVCYNSVD